MSKKGVLWLVAMLAFSCFASAEVVLLSPVDKTYINDGGINRTRIYIDYSGTEYSNKTLLDIDGVLVMVRNQNLVEAYSHMSEITLEDSEDVANISKVYNHFEYSYNVSAGGRGSVTVNLSGSGNRSIIIGYSRDKIWYCKDDFRGNQGLLEGISDKTYSFMVEAYNDGRQFTYFDVFIDGVKKGRCSLSSGLTYIDSIHLSSYNTLTRFTFQEITAGTYYAELIPGNHTIRLDSTSNTSDANVSSSDMASFRIVMDGCGDGVCEGKESMKTCSADCLKITCLDSSLIGDTNGDNLVDLTDKRNLLNIIEGRIDPTSKDCCLDINKDGTIDESDHIMLGRLVNKNGPYERCNLTCEDGTQHGKCSNRLPFFCDYGELVEVCDICGCSYGWSCTADRTCFPLQGCACSDVAAVKKDVLGFDNIIDGYDSDAITENSGYCRNSTGNSTGYIGRYDLNYDGCVSAADVECVRFFFNNKTSCSGPLHCIDGTLYKGCSSKIPFFCDEGTLISSCERCGCSTYAECSASGECAFNDILNFSSSAEPGSKNSAYISGGRLFMKTFNDGMPNMTLHAAHNLENVSMFIVLDNNISASFDDETMNLSEGSYNARFRFDNLVRGRYNGSFRVLLAGNEYLEIPAELHADEGIWQPIVRWESSDRNHRNMISYFLIMLALAIIMIVLFRRRRKQREFLRKMEKQHKLILE